MTGLMNAGNLVVLARKEEELEENPRQCHFIYHKSHSSRVLFI
jgi:hypothetical protein